MILDSNFLVHLERERRRQKTGPASAFLLSHSGEPLFVTPTIAGEIAAGESMADVGLWKAFIGVFQLLEIVDEVTWRYGQVSRVHNFCERYPVREPITIGGISEGFLL